MTYYEILEVSQDAGFGQIKSSYRRLVKIYHPDLNPSALAKERILQITEAYEVLSDPLKKQAYDLQLQFGSSTSYSPPPPTYQDERELRKQEYIRRKRAQDQRHWEQMFHMKVKFYKAQRLFAGIFLLVAAVYSWDYYFLEDGGTYKVEKVALSKWGECGVRLSGHRAFQTSQEFFHAVSGRQSSEVKMYYSVLHDVPVAVQLDHGGFFKISDTVHSFNNFFAYLLAFLGIVLLVNHKYSDWSLTLGLVPFFIMAFLLLLTYTTRLGG